MVNRIEKALFILILSFFAKVKYILQLKNIIVLFIFIYIVIKIILIIFKKFKKNSILLYIINAIKREGGLFKETINSLNEQANLENNENKSLLDKINSIEKKVISLEAGLFSYIKFEYIYKSIDINRQLLYTIIKINEINQKISSTEILILQNKMKKKIIEILDMILYLNNARLLLSSRKFVNCLLKKLIKNNECLKISKEKYLMKLSVYNKYKDNYKVIKNYIAPFILKIEGNTSDIDYNATLDFLFFLKSYFNDNIHYEEANQNITFNFNYYNFLFGGESTQSTSEEEYNNANNSEKEDKKEKIMEEKDNN